MSTNYYELLGVPRNASADEIRSAVRKLAFENHPDRLRSLNLPEDELNERIEKMKQVSIANDILLKPEKRARYDLTGTEPEQQEVMSSQKHK